MNIRPGWFNPLPLLVALLAFAGPRHCDALPGGEMTKLRPVAACPALVAVARTNQIPMDQRDPLSGVNAIHPGDSVTILGTLVSKKTEAQWLLYIEAAPPDSPKIPAKKPKPFVVSMSGTRMEFESKPVPANLRMFGPFSAADMTPALKPMGKDAQFSLNESFLGLGLEQAAAVMWRQSWMTNAENSTSPSEQRAVASVFPALMSYLDIATHTEGLEDLLAKLIDRPSVWSMIWHGGMHAQISFNNAEAPPFPAHPEDWDLPPSTPVYCFPCLLRLNGRPAVKITLVVTRPQPPLLTCGGVVGLLGEKVGDDETYVTLRLVSARCKTDR